MNYTLYFNNRSTDFHDYDGEIFYPLVKHPLHVVFIFSVAYGLAFISAIIGNCFVVAVVLKYSWMRNVTNYFVVNLAVADILVAIFCIPFTLLDNIYSGKFE